MNIFWRLVLGHFLADFTLQFDVVARLKRKNFWGMLLHCLTHYAASVALTWPYMGDVWVTVWGLPVSGWWAQFLMFATHLAIDETRLYSMRVGYRDNTLSFLVDQALHIYVLFMITPVFQQRTLQQGGKWVMIAAMFVLVTHFTTVLIYFVEKDLYGKAFPCFDEKYFLMFERLVLWAFFFVPGHWWLPFAVAWAVQMLWVKRKRIMDMSGVNVLISAAMSMMLGALSRVYYYGSF